MGKLTDFGYPVSIPLAWLLPTSYELFSFPIF